MSRASENLAGADPRAPVILLIGCLVSSACGAGGSRSGGHAPEGGASSHALPPPADAAVAPADAGVAGLTTLAVTSAASSTLTLVPAFAPTTFDYYIQCTGHTASPAVNSLSLSFHTVAGATATVSLETPGGGLAQVAEASAEGTDAIQAMNDQAIVVTVKGPAADAEYWVRCLSDDFPEMRWDTHAGGAPRTPGYYLLGTMALPSGARGSLAQESGYAIVLDTKGVPVWYKLVNAYGTYDVESLAPHDLSFSSPWQVDTLQGATIYPVAQDVRDGGHPLPPDEHELRYVAVTGHYFGFNSATETADMTGLSLPGTSGTVTYGPNTTIYGCWVQEFDATGTVFWQWSATDHFNPATAMVVKGDGDLGGPIVAPFHCNSIDVDPANGNLLVSARDMSTVFYIDKATGKVLWMMGSAPASSCYDHPIDVPIDDPFVAQHDARLVTGWNETCSGGNGRVSVFDDESYTTHPARGVLYDVTIAAGCGDGGAATGGTTGAKAAWMLAAPLDASSSACGSFRVTADGSRIVGWGQSSPAPNGVVFTEADDAGHDILDLVCPDNSSSYRAVKLPLSAFSVDSLRAAAGL